MHILRVTDLGDGEFDREILHEEDCPTEVQWMTPNGREIRGHTCGVGYWSDNYGLDELKDDSRFVTEGEYPIDFYSYVPLSMFEDADAYLFYADEPTDK